MAKVILHIGTHKTATTTLQDMFARNAALLAAHGVIYPQIASVAGHHGLVKDWVPIADHYRLPAGSMATWEMLAASYGTGDHTVFLSSEEFSRGNPQARVDWAAVRVALAPFDRVEVICLLREQWQFLQSVYLEVGKKRQVDPPEQWLKLALDRDLVAGLWMDYSKLYQQLLQDFAPDEICFYDYDQARRGAGGILGQILRHLNIGLSVAQLEAVNGGRSNPSPQPLPSFAAAVIAAPSAAPSWVVEAATRAFEHEYGAGRRNILWTRAELQRLQDYAAARNCTLSAQLAAVQPGFALSSSTPAPDTIYREDINRDFWRRSARGLYHARVA